ncbi:adventurous gliding motility protein AgmC [Myxococcus eversor]|uniref:adventurous gliding motility protein AgmC n=1 Tax=Myxococcus eversor TaxID=2709661 RepID=UPI0013D86933|nr:Ig-like domain-containing protein [Myxococcus eversor]
MRTLLTRVLLWGVLLMCGTASAELDRFGLGGATGMANDKNFGTTPSAQHLPNSHKALTQDAAQGTTVLRFTGTFTGLANNGLLMIIQSTGLSPAPARGTTTPIDLSGAGTPTVGQWELAEIQSFNSNSVTLTRPLANSYKSPGAQMLTVPRYRNVTVQAGATVTAAPWDGSSGGVLAFLASGTLTNDGIIDASKLGFRGGTFTRDPTTDCSGAAAGKLGVSGEDVAPAQAQSVDNSTNGGGGGSCNSGGGGGGGNGGPGGIGGLAGTTLAGGKGGVALSGSVLSWLTFGGGGGSGHTRSAAPATTGGAGGKGGGIIFIRAASLLGIGTILANGENGVPTSGVDVGHGGGAGGTLHLRFTGSATCGADKVNAGGGTGEDSAANSGPGGGGGGGRVFFQAQGPVACSPLAAAGVAGLQAGVIHHGAMPTSSTVMNYRGSVTVLDLAFIDGIQPPTFVSPPATDAWTNNPLLRGTTQQGLSEVLFYTVSGTATPFTYALLDRTTSDSLKAFVFPYAPPSSNGAPFRLAAQAGYLGAYSDIGPELKFTFDNVPPVTTLTPVSVPLVSRFASATFNLTSTESGGTFECALDNLAVVGDGILESCGASKTFNSLTTGDYRVTAVAIDRAGNRDPSPKSYTWRVDLTQPDTLITGGPVASPPGNPTNSRVAQFTFSGGVTYQCSLDGVLPAVACGPSQTYTEANLGEGPHTLSVTAYSESGVADPTPATRAWVIDTVAPDTSFFNPPVSPSNASSVTLEYRSPDATAKFECSTNGVTFTACAGTGSGTRTFSGLISGTSQQFHVRAVDPAGNIDPSPVSHTWLVDLDAPATIIINTPGAGLGKESRPTIGGTTEAGARVVVTVTPSGPGTAQTLNAVAGPSGSWSVIPAVLVDGSYTLSAEATDAAGNSRQSSSVSITVDTLPPSRPVLAASIQGRYFTTMPISLSGTLESAVGLAPNTTVTVYVDDSVTLGPTPVDAQGGWSVSFTPSPLQDGFHWVRAMTRDAAGNVSSFSETSTFHVDLSPPVVPIINNPGPFLTTLYPLLSGTAEVGTSLQVYFGPSPDPVTVSVGPDGRWTYLRTTPLNEGPYTAVFVRSTDVAERVTDSASVSFIVDVTKPETTILLSPPVRDGATTVLFRLARPEPLTYECRRSTGGVMASTFTPCPPAPPGPGIDASYIQLANLVDGSNTLMVRAVDEAGNRDDSPAVYTWSISTGAISTEIVTGPGGPDAPISQRNADFLLYSNKGVVDFECKLERLVNPVPGLNFSPCPRNPTDAYDIARYENLPDNTYTLVVRAVFAGAPDPLPVSWTWEVDGTAPTMAPRITAPRANHPTNQRRPSIQGETPEPGTITLYRDGAFWGNTVATGGAWIFNPPSDLGSGQYQITATLTDLAKNVGPASVTYTLIVDVEPPVVTIVSSPPVLTNVSSFSFTFSFLPAEELESYECALDTPVFTPCPNPYSRAATGEGEHKLTVRGKDLAGNFTEQLVYASHTWVVDTLAPNSTIATKPKELSNSTEAVFTFTSSEDDVEYFCKLGAAEFVSCNPTEYRLTDLGRRDVEAQEYVLQVKTVDRARNEDPTPDIFRWTVDLKRPGVPSLSVPRANDILSVRTPTFQGDAEAESTVSILVDEVEIGTVQTDASGDWRFVPRNELDYGSHTVTLVSKDKAGNESERSSVVNFVLDPSLEIDARGGGLSCASAGGGGGVSLVLLALGGLALRLGRRRRVS